MGKKIELWVLLLVIWFGIVFTIVFSWSLKSELVGWKRAGMLGRIAYHTSNIPTLTRDLLFYKKSPESKPLIKENKWPEINGFSKNGQISKNVLDDKGYLLLSAYSGEQEQSTVKLIRIHDQKIIHEWIPNIDDIKETHKKMGLENLPEDFDLTSLSKSRYRTIHPLLLDDGSIIFNNFSSYLIKISKCSDALWVSDIITHHSLEMDKDSNIWASIRIFPTIYDTINENFIDDAIALVNIDGEVIYKKSVTEMLLENGYQGLLWGVGPDAYEFDPIHLNDIQPVFTKSKYWDVGDVFLSIRNKSTILLYRPITNKILWLKTGPWLAQHDVNILNDSQISVFDNNTIRTSPYEKSIGYSNVYIVDFEKDLITSPYSSILKEVGVMERTEGRATILEDGDVVIDETSTGRLLRISQDDVKWEYTATIDSSNVGMGNWSRYLTYDQVKDVLPILEKCECSEKTKKKD